MKHIKIYIFLFIIFLAVHLHADDAYFPAKIFYPERPDADERLSSWYSMYLKALEEPSIYQQKSDKNKTIIRFTLLPAFTDTIAIRLEVDDKGFGTLNVKMINDQGKIILSEKKGIKKSTVSSIMRFIEDADFWSLPSKIEEEGLDGSQWIIEILSNGKYHLVDRWSPGFGPVQKLGNIFMGLSRQNKGK